MVPAQLQRPDIRQTVWPFSNGPIFLLLIAGNVCFFGFHAELRQNYVIDYLVKQIRQLMEKLQQFGNLFCRRKSF